MDGSRTSKIQRKASDGEERYEYYGEDGWWEEEGYHFASYDAAYYEEWQEGRAEDIFEVDLYSMVFMLDENLMPKDMYYGFEFDEKSCVFVLEAEDVAPTTPAAWKSRPLKIHPEPPPFRKDVMSTPPPRSGAATDANTGGSNTPTAPGGRTPRQKAPKTPTPKVQTPPLRPVEPPQDSDQSGDDEGQTGKIHISNRQLEHLKQKMQVLKQRRASTEEEKKEETPREAPTEVVHSNCPGAHGLSLFKTPAKGWWCSVCEKEHEKGAAFYGCRTCDYDECRACAMTPRAKEKPQKPQKPPESEAKPPKEPAVDKAPQPMPKKAASSSSSSGDSSSKSPSPKKEKKEKKKEEKKESKEASKEKSVKKTDGKREAQDKRKGAKVKVKKTVKRPSKAAKSKSSERSNASDDKVKKAKKREKRAASDPKLVPRKKEKEPNSREPKRRKEEKLLSPSRSPVSKSRSRSRDDSEVPKRAANALTVAAERVPVSLTRASATRRTEEEKPRADEAARARRNEPVRRGDGADLLRRVLRANAQAGRKEEPRATLVPTRNDEEEGTRGATLRPERGIKKALDGLKSRRV